MPESLLIALQITVVGLGLVFGAIVLFWGLMSVLVRVMADPEPAVEDEPEAPAPIPDPISESTLKLKAAAAAVAIALADARPAGHPPSTALVSAWQAVMRANQLGQRGPVR